MSSHVKDLVVAVAPWYVKARDFAVEFHINYPHFSGAAYGALGMLVLDLLIHLR